LERIREARVVLEVGTALDNLQLIQKAQPNLLLVDIDAMGSDLHSVIQLRQFFVDTKILLLTDREDAEFEVQAVKAGAQGCFSKNGEPEALEKALKAVGRNGEVWVSRQAAARIIGRFLRSKEVEDTPSAELTPREWEILALAANGYHNKEIAARLFISENTVKTHLHTIYKKLGVTSRMAAALHYFEQAKKKASRRWFGLAHPKAIDAARSAGDRELMPLSVGGRGRRRGMISRRRVSTPARPKFFFLPRTPAATHALPHRAARRVGARFKLLLFSLGPPKRYTTAYSGR
jgi:DNA-binding NarL/FixJ family response regulator